MRDLQKNAAFVARNVIFKESEIGSLKSVSEVGFNDFPNNEEELSLRQNPNEAEGREHITHGQIVPPAQAASHGSVLQQLKQKNESGDNGSWQQRANTQTSSSHNLATLSKPIRFVSGMSASESQTVPHDRFLPTPNKMEPRKVQQNVKVPTPFGQNFTQSPVIIEETELFSY